HNTNYNNCNTLFALFWLIKMFNFTGYLHSYEEAYLLIHAVRLGFIEPKRERLSLKEREKIKSGSIFIFMEKQTLIMRWTDGMTWSPSKILGSFLLYKQVPKFLTKNATKKSGLLKNQRQKCIPLEKQLQKDKFHMHKKTISLTHENETYHIISYFEPIFDKRGISELPFFLSLQRAIQKYPELQNDRFIEILIEKNINISRKYNILEFKPENLRPRIDRDQMIKDAVNVLSTCFKHQI
ncbi:Gluconate transport-inducing protein, partial [Pseudoloma neurophilia]